MVTLNLKRCLELAELLRSVPIPEDREDTSLPQIDRQWLPNFLFMVVAICHQTTPATGELPLEGFIDGRHAKGWDYLLQRLALAAQANPAWTDVGYWARVRGSDLREVLRDRTLGERLTDPDGRASLIRDLGETMLSHGWLSAAEMHRHCSGRIRGAEPNLVSELARFRAYSDPVRKKTFFFLSLMQNFNLWTFADPEGLGPPADYHEVRGHLRIGTVRVDDSDLERRLIVRLSVSVEEDNAIRACVVQAIEAVATALNTTPSRVHYLFWNVFRNVCTRQRPQCFELLPDNQLPDRYRPLVQISVTGRGCPFSAVCQSAGLETMIQDPVVITEFH